jgi:polyisoprenoid-binding protein YceI
MQAPSRHMTAPALQALLKDGVLAGEWVLDPRKSSIRLTNKSMAGLVRVNGIFHDVGGNATVCADGEASGTLRVAPASIDTKNTRRDTHLRSADFFDSAGYPDITFTADNVRPSDAGVAVTGALTVRDRTRPLSFGAAASVRGDGEIWLDAEVHINRADFGLTWNRLGLASMNNTLAIHAVFTRRCGC